MDAYKEMPTSLYCKGHYSDGAVAVIVALHCVLLLFLCLTNIVL